MRMPRRTRPRPLGSAAAASPVRRPGQPRRLASASRATKLSCMSAHPLLPDQVEQRAERPVHFDSLTDPDPPIGERLVAVLAAQSAERDPGPARPHPLRLDRGDRDRARRRPAGSQGPSNPVPTADRTIGAPMVCSSGRRRLSSAVPITGTRRLRLAVRGPVEQLGVLATLSRWRSRVQIPSGPQGSPVRFHWGPSQVR